MKNRGVKRMLSLLLTAAMLAATLPTAALAAEGPPCENHLKHDAACGYMAPVEGQPCKHEQGEHDEECGFVEGTPETPCDQGCAEVDETGAVLHAEGCAYAPAVEGTPCGHVEHTEACGFKAAVEGRECSHSCDLCATLDSGPTLGTSGQDDQKRDSGTPSTTPLGDPPPSGARIENDNYIFEPSSGKLTVKTTAGTKAWREDTGIAENVGDRLSAIREVEIQDGVTSIEEEAFVLCENLSQVKLPNSLTSIGSCAFESCTNLALASLPSGISSIEAGTFSGCTSLALTSLPSGVTSIGSTAFNGCTSLGSLDLSGCTSLSTIGVSAFEGCTNLDLTSLPGKVTSIGVHAFEGCTSLALTSLPSGVTSIPDYAFYNCASLKLETLPADLTSIGEMAFSECPNLALKSLPSGVTSIPNYAFYRCTNLKLETLPADLTSIGKGAFIGCASLELTSLPEKVTSIGESAFAQCTNLALASLPSGVKSIPQNAFWDCANLKLETLPADLTSIGQGALAYCTSLGLKSLPEKVSSIGEEAFRGCTSLESLDMSGCTSLSAIRDVAFSDCTNLKSVSFPKNLTSIGDNAFGFCSSLGSISLPPNLNSMGSGAFRHCYSLSLTSIPSGVTSIPYAAFYRCINLKLEVLPNSLTSIGELAFYDCIGLTSLTLSNANAPTLNGAAFGGETPNLAIFVPHGANGYTAENNWPMDKVVFGAALSKLGISGGSLSPSFFPGTNTYTLSLPLNVPSVVFTPTAHGSGAITVDGTPVASGSQSAAFSVDYGQTRAVSIAVTNGGDDTRTYTVNIQRVPEAAIGLTAIGGVTAPARGKAPVSAVTETDQYTGAVAWNPAPGAAFASDTQYTATITLTPKDGYTLQGVAENAFTVAGATATNAANSGVITAVFPKTGSAPSEGGGGGGGDDTPSPTEQAVDKIQDAKPGDTVKVDLPGSGKLPNEILEEAAGKDITLEIDAGKGVTWIINGKDIPKGKLSDLDLKVNTKASTIPVTVINALTGERKVMQLELRHNGPFGFPLTLRLEIGGENAGLWANLYYYDEAAETLDYQAAVQIGADGKADIPFSHASSYAIVIDAASHDKTNPNTGGGNPFTDVAESDWFFSAVMYVYHAGIMQGTSDTTFTPNGSATRAQLATILWRMEGSPAPTGGNPFSDVASGQWYAPGITWAAGVGLVDGYDADTYGPADPVTREQLAAILWRYAKYKGWDVSQRDGLTAYADAGEVSSWAREAVEWAVGAGLMNGASGNRLSPQAGATRAQLAQMLMRLLEKYAPGFTLPVTPNPSTGVPQTGEGGGAGLLMLALPVSAGAAVLCCKTLRRRKGEPEPDPT